MSLCSSLHVSVAWGLLNFLDVCIYSLHQIWKVFGYYFLDFFSFSFSPLFMGTTITLPLGLQKLSCSWVRLYLRTRAPSAPPDLPSFVSSTQGALQTQPGFSFPVIQLGNFLQAGSWSNHRTHPICVFWHHCSLPSDVWGLANHHFICMFLVY